MKPSSWKRVKRDTLFESPFITLNSDTVELPDGTTVKNYTVATLPSGVVVVATDSEGKLLTQYEYKYAVDSVVVNLPSGSVESGEDPIDTAIKELREETGYTADSFELVCTLYEYPSKLDHRIYIVRAKNARKVHTTEHESTESIGSVMLVDPKNVEAHIKFDTTYAVSALALTEPVFLQRS